MRVNTKKRTILISIIVVICVLFVGFALWWNGYFMPSWVTWNNKEEVIGNGTIVLNDKHLTLEKNGEVYYKTLDKWMVSDFLITDFDEDGEDEVLMLVWSHEDYGQSHPFWENKDYFTFSQHLYVFNIDGLFMQSQWMSSRLKPNIKEWSINDKQELTIIDPDDNVSVWKWVGYHVERIDNQ